MKTEILVLALALAGCYRTPSTAATPELSKADAIKILEHAGFKNVLVAGVVNGIGSVTQEADGKISGFSSSQNVATVVGYWEGRDGPVNLIVRTTFLYDKDLGWFYYVPDLVRRRVAICTTTGCKFTGPPQ